ncbi:hypothetical protein SCHIN_v1c11710 [Spiroplasma chinense]|uniref:Uncharacterized protein n=1 Tax=Spiroplasma chinense TaxID=216932 RepID=A0A5B9Y5K0_9MOLU|nr:hypothetical protein [Spiroplasma chinense]QEH62364.1 hypothetical protein SCHIN_v1c11710 [Spiroplasma chinense]
MVWGESNSREFLDWADFCRNKAMQSRGITRSGGPNFSADKSSAEYRMVKEQVLNHIQKSRTISVQQLYNTLPSNLVENPTLKNVLLQLYYEDNLQIQSQSSNTSDRETNFVLVFVKKASPPPQRAPRPDAPSRKQSNIEDLIDNDWRATGRRLDFDKKEPPKRDNLNINLKRNPQPTINKPAVKPVIDVRQKIEIPKIEPITVTTPSKPIKEMINENLTYIQIPKPEPVIEEKIVEQPTMTLNLEFRPEPSRVEVEIEEKVFYGLSAYDLYYLEAFLRDASHKETQDVEKITITRDIVKVRADIIYIKNKDSMNIGLKILFGLSCLLVVGLLFIGAVTKNKVRKKAFKDYNSRLKSIGYDVMKTELKDRHPRIVEF